MSVWFIALLALGLLAISIFKKHVLISFALCILWLGVAYTHEASTFEGGFFVSAGCSIIIAYEIYEMSKMRTKTK